MDFIETHIDYQPDWETVSSNPNLIMDFIKYHTEYYWKLKYITSNVFIKDKEMFIIEESTVWIIVESIFKISFLVRNIYPVK
tara:strand:- start:129 stop:374 length:246 start_codon:yes stop_codon:yes gene_type:complete